MRRPKNFYEPGPKEPPWQCGLPGGKLDCIVDWGREMGDSYNSIRIVKRSGGLVLDFYDTPFDAVAVRRDGKRLYVQLETNRERQEKAYSLPSGKQLKQFPRPRKDEVVMLDVWMGKLYGGGKLKTSRSISLDCGADPPFLFAD